MAVGSVAQGRDDPQVRRVTRGEKQALLGVFQRREAGLQHAVFVGVAADEGGGSRTAAPSRGGVRGGGAHLRVARHPEVVVGAEQAQAAPSFTAVSSAVSSLSPRPGLVRILGCLRGERGGAHVVRAG